MFYCAAYFCRFLSVTLNLHHGSSGGRRRSHNHPLPPPEQLVFPTKANASANSVLWNASALAHPNLAVDFMKRNHFQHRMMGRRTNASRPCYLVPAPWELALVNRLVVMMMMVEVGPGQQVVHDDGGSLALVNSRS